MTPETLAKCWGITTEQATTWAGPITEAMRLHRINTIERQAMFLAQVGHESGCGRYTVEIWGPTPAQTRYEGRADLGNTRSGDGSRFRGRGLIQITGRANYQAVSDALSVDAIGNPDLLSKPPLAALASGWWWQNHGLNEISDAKDVVRATKRINGGTNGLKERQALYEAAMDVLFEAPALPAVVAPPPATPTPAVTGFAALLSAIFSLFKRGKP